MRYYKKRRSFHFEAVWMRDERCEGVVHDAWGIQISNTPTKRLINKIKACRIRLQSWNRHSFGNTSRFLVQKGKLLVQAEAISMVGQNHT